MTFKTQHKAGTEKSQAMAVRSDKGELWFLHRVRIRNVQVSDITFEATSDNGADVWIPITADVTASQWVALESEGWERQWGMANRSPIWNQALFHPAALVSQTVK